MEVWKHESLFSNEHKSSFFMLKYNVFDFSVDRFYPDNCRFILCVREINAL